MLEIKNVTKIYKLKKGGVETKALDDVSISFGETGMVFLLGKSGSGKSTLLNVSGGLDEPTSGEVIVKGKSSKDFSGSDFDSYRNTFVGFVFQEYNILDEFNVEDNIALALELQGKPKDKEKINELLKEVELEQYAKRKPNTLSGGQKQRIAIARALVKDPQIIMADEPTGALDSATGKQVFDTLKALSKTRLVIVVSHDREFAEIYGDRIVELKDGKIISDVTKSSVPPEALDENISVIGGNTLSIKKGASLTASNFKAIQKFISESDGNVLISNGDKEIDNFRKANRMSDEDATEKFSDTEKVELKEYTPDQSKFIRSKLPASKALKIGASGLKLKPVRLVFTILLSFIAFTLFGLMTTLMLYDNDKIAATSFAQSDYEYLTLNKHYSVTVSYGDDSYDYSNAVNFTQTELDKFKASFGNDTFGYYSKSLYGSEDKLENVNTPSDKQRYYRTAVSKYAYLPQNHSLRNNITGSYPKNDDEILISGYLYDCIANSDLYGVEKDEYGNVSVSNKNKLTINSKQDLIGKYIMLGFDRYEAFKITGIFDSGEIDSKYETIKTSNDEYKLEYRFKNYLAEGMHQTVFTNENFYENHKKNFQQSAQQAYYDYTDNMITVLNQCADFNYDRDEITINEDGNYFINSYCVSTPEKSPREIYFFDKRTAKTLNKDEVIVELKTLQSYGSPVKAALTQYYYDDILSGTVYPEIEEEYNPYFYDGEMTKALAFDGASFLSGKFEEYINDYFWNYELSDKDAQRLFQKFTSIMSKKSFYDAKISTDGFNSLSMKIAGFYYSPDRIETYDNGALLFNEDFIKESLTLINEERKEQTNYVPEEGAIYSGVQLVYDGTADGFKDVLKLIGEENKLDNDVYYTLENSLYESIETVNMYAELLSKVFLWVGIALAVFSSLLLFNFISVSISNKKKEIGILRAVGARGIDVFKIFFAESGIIVGICTVLALIGSFVACTILNNVLKNSLGLQVTLFVFGIASVGMLIGIALIVTLIATFLPVYFTAKKKPVDSIRAL